MSDKKKQEPRVTVARIPGKVSEVKAHKGATVEDVLVALNVNPEGFDVRLNGESASMDQKVYRNDQLMLVVNIKGNTRRRTVNIK